MTHGPLTVHQQASSFTKDLFELELDVLKPKQGFSENVNTKVIGRVVTSVVALALHAEAVCRAVYICFLAIKNIFSQTHHHLIADQKGKCFSALDVSLKSFIALFNQSIFADLYMEQREKGQPQKVMD